VVTAIAEVLRLEVDRLGGENHVVAFTELE